MERDAQRGRMLIEESREAVVVLDEEGRVLAASRRARQSLDGVLEGELLPAELLRTDAGPDAARRELFGRRANGAARLPLRGR